MSRYSLNIITKKSEVSNITFDGTSIGNYFLPVPESDYAYARINTYGGNHTIRSNDGFIAYVYGFGQNESFGYATGASLGNLNIDFIVNDQNEKTPIDSLCLGSEITFQPIVDSIYTLFEYDFGDGYKVVTQSDTPVIHQYNRIGEYLVTLRASTGGNDCSNGNEEISRKLIRIIEPNTRVFGPRSVCPNTTDVAYYLKESLQNFYQWFVKGGYFSEQEPKSVKVNWLETNNLAKIQLLASNRYGCISDTISYPVKINIQLDPEAPFGPDTLCSNDIVEVPYESYFTNSSVYQWDTDFGTISNGNGTNQITINWESYGNGKLWFNQHSVTDTVCDGMSDTLLVYIQRNPSELGSIVVEKDTFYLGETVRISLDADTLFQFANWSFDDGTTLDTINAKKSIDHIFQCQGLHSFSAVAYDTGTVCSETKALLYKQIYILPPNIDLINVTLSATQENALDIHWQMNDGNFYTKNLYLYRTIAGQENWKPIATLNPEETSYTDPDVNTIENSYEYKIETNTDCEDILTSKIHQSILLQSQQEDSVGYFNWNNYLDWQNGVDHYEIWISIDSSEYRLFENNSTLQFTYLDQNTGFDHCFEIRAIEKNGNNSMSISNTSCVAFVPKIKTYNIITPNTDRFNEYFTIDNIEHYPNSKLSILNRWGETIFETIGYKNDWNGKNHGKQMLAGTYYYQLDLNEPRNEIKTIKGFFSILY